MCTWVGGDGQLITERSTELWQPYPSSGRRADEGMTVFLDLIQRTALSPRLRRSIHADPRARDHILVLLWVSRRRSRTGRLARVSPNLVRTEEYRSLPARRSRAGRAFGRAAPGRQAGARHFVQAEPHPACVARLGAHEGLHRCAGKTARTRRARWPRLPFAWGASGRASRRGPRSYSCCRGVGQRSR